LQSKKEEKIGPSSFFAKGVKIASKNTDKEETVRVASQTG
jgi:hypothetical protein